MSGKPASVAASRAGAPRVLVYVAERQLDGGTGPGPAAEPPPAAPALPHYLHADHQPTPVRTLCTPHLDSDQRNSLGNIYYKSLNESDSGNIGAYGTNDGTVAHRPNFLPTGQQFFKEQCSKLEENKVNERPNSDKRENFIRSGAEFGNLENYRVPLESGEIATYQARCQMLGNDNVIPPMQAISVHQDHNQFNNCVVQNGDNSCDREQAVTKNIVNYQFVEQSVSHQSIVNQNISIVGERGCGRSEENPGSVVLAVLPSHEVETARTLHIDAPQTITVPLGWRRIINGSSVLYISPSGAALSTLPQLREYLQTTGTCKCGLPCPLRPETTFSFDPKVVSKPYQPASGAELTKLCNHKRKLLATLQARAQSPATPPPQHLDHKKVCVEVGALKKKMKKRPAVPPNVNVSQIVVQRERPLHEFKPQDSEFRRTISPGVNMRPIGNHSCMSTFTPVQHIPNSAQDDSPIQKGAHYLTVHSGLITQHENIDTLHKVAQPAGTVNNAMNIGLPVLGTNGQIIGVNTGFNKHANYKNNINVMTQHFIEQQKEEKKEIMQHNAQTNKQTNKEEESQIFCGLNQPLTPEVMQKINEQQQIFIQQNQKQIEMAMKGFRTQLAENLNQNKPQNQNQFVPQGQLVIQNGAVVKANPAKTPPWQVKRNDSNSSAVMSPSPKHQKLDSGDFEESTSVSEDSSGSYSPYPQNDQAMCSRVPPLPQHYNIVGQQWPGVDANKRKPKTPSKGRKKAIPVENKIMSIGNNGMRILQDSKGNICEEIPNNNVPSFMDDPSGYLAQQTVLLNNTISRQVNATFENNHFESSNNCYTTQNSGDKISKPVGKPFEGQNIYRGNMVPNPSPSPNHTPDSSVITDNKNTDNSFTQCCKGCNASMKNNTELTDNHMRLKYMKQNVYKFDFDGNATNSSPRHGFEENPVTSSTFIERSPMSNDNCGPIQAGTVSTSNVSPPDTMQQPEPSPTLSNSSRSTDTPQSSSGTNSSHIQLNNCTFPMPSPAYSNQGSSRDNYNSNPSTPGCAQTYHYNSPGPSNSQSVTGTQVMNFISNHNVNKNLMEVDNISMVGVKPVMKTQEFGRTDMRRRVENSMPGYCPPPHLGSGPAQSLIQACYVQTFVTTMASGFSVTRNTVTSVLAGKANTATTSINASQANFVRPPPPPSVNLATTYAIPNNQPDPFINSVNIPTSYPLHIAGTTAQNMISKCPVEMVQVMGSVSSKTESSNVQTNTISISAKRTATPGQILISSTGQIMVSNNTMPPPPPKTTNTVSSMHNSNMTTSVNTCVSQVVPAVQPMVNQSTVVVNTLPAPFVIQPPMMAVDGQVVQQNTVLPQIVTGVVPGQQTSDNTRQIDIKNGQGFLQGVAMLSPESNKKRSKKKKVHNTTNITNVLQITAPQQNANNIMVHSSPQHNTSPQFSPRGFQLSPNNNISPTTPMLQALTIVPGKSGTPAHIVMNGQGNTNNFGSQQIITNTSPSQQINLLQPVNLINNASGVVSNFPTFQQFIVPNLGGMVMTADGTIIQENSTGMPVQLQLQTVNGQNVLTPVQNPGVFTASANGGVVIRAQNQQSKIIQSQHSPGAQFLSPNSQVMMNSPNFNGQLSPLLANLSPTNVTFNTNPQVRSTNVQAQEFIQANQMGQMMVPLSPKRASIASVSRGNSTFVQQNTTIVQQQTTLVSNSHAAQMPAISSNGSTRLSIDPHALLAKQRSRFVETSPERVEVKDEIPKTPAPKPEGEEGWWGSSELSARQSVWTQTRGRARSPGGSSPPDTTTRSPPGPDPAPSPTPYAPRPLSTHAHYADTTTESPEPADGNSSGMVQCVSSSEQDMAESREMAWRTPRNDFPTDNDTQNMLHTMPIVRQNRTPSSAEPPELHYTHHQNMNTSSMSNQHLMPVSSNYYDRPQSYKRKNDYGDGSTYRTDKIMRTNNGMVHGMPKDTQYDPMGMGAQDKMHARHYQSSGSRSDNSDASMMERVFDRHNLGSGDDIKSENESDEKSSPEDVGGDRSDRFEVGEVVWGPVKGHASWPGKVVARRGQRATVRWFGRDRDRSLAALDVARLLTLDEGLEAHHAASTRHRKSRKLNTLLENAIQEAMAELDKKSENASDRTEESAVGEVGLEEISITETPRSRGKKMDRARKDKHKKNPLTSTKTTDTRLRSSR